MPLQRRTVRAVRHAPAPGKTQATCYYDPDTDELLYCDPDTLILLYCEGDSGGGGGGDDDDEEEADDENDCACDEDIPCAMEAEYEEYGVDFTITCDQFTTTGGSAHFSWSELNGHWAGGNEGEHRPWGYIDPGLPGMLETARQHYGGPLELSSGYRCPAGNARNSGHAQSFHMRGRAADVSSSYGCIDVATAFEAAGLRVVGCEDHPDHIHGQWVM